MENQCKKILYIQCEIDSEKQRWPIEEWLKVLLEFLIHSHSLFVPFVPTTISRVLFEGKETETNEKWKREVDNNKKDYENVKRLQITKTPQA